LPAFFDRFETKTIGLEINKSSVSLTGAIIVQMIPQEIIPNFISSIDLSSGFFQMSLSCDSS
jgi:hypothetical protein